MKEYVGKKFGSLQVLREISPKISPCGRKERLFECLCDCGNIIDKTVSFLNKAKTKSCGRCHFPKINDKKGKVTVTSEPFVKTSNSGEKRYWIRVKCECGNEIETILKDFVAGKVQSCGCARIEKTIDRNIKGRKPNDYVFYDGFATGYDTHGNSFKIDLDDYDIVKQYRWMANKEGYFSSTRNGKYLRLHRLIMDCPDDLVVDHINHDVSDNRKCNLRVVTQSQNGMNRNCKPGISGVKGVYWNLECQKWISGISVNGNRIILGRYRNLEDAIESRRKAEQEYFGEYNYNPYLDARNSNSVQD